MTVLKSYSLRTDQGPYLHLNEDDVCVDLTYQIFMIFDGFGGSGNGDRVVEIAKESLRDFYNSFSRDHDKTLPFFYNARFPLEGNALVNALKLAHQKVLDHNTVNASKGMGGVSAIAIVKNEDHLFCVSTGNCLGLKVSKGKVFELISPDNFKYYKKDHEVISAFSHPKSAIGLFNDLEYKTTELKVFNGDQIILLTDGIYAHLSSEEITAVLNMTDRGWSEKIDELFLIANERGNLDNQSTIILNF